MDCIIAVPVPITLICAIAAGSCHPSFAAPNRRVSVRLSSALRLVGCIAVLGMPGAGSWTGRIFMHRHPG
jgi:hypothetical protein